ncbi:MAG: hypothetical protein LBU22_04475 [Dysgonamonadaceae bacterium]|nr:hypothetical protein [Dysgonamonadaceae bacterium]
MMTGLKLYYSIFLNETGFLSRVMCWSCLSPCFITAQRRMLRKIYLEIQRINLKIRPDRCRFAWLVHYPRKRNAFFQENRPLNSPAKHIKLADTRYHLGTADPAKIELVKLGWDEESFV